MNGDEHVVEPLPAATVAFAITAHRGRVIGIPKLAMINLVLLDATRDAGVVRLDVRSTRKEFHTYVRDGDELLVDMTISRACTPIGGHAPDSIHIGCILR